VVVESHARGGSLITAEAAIERGIEVRVVPGPVHSSASAGSNQLLYDGPGPVRDARDVLDALGLFRDTAVGPGASQTPTAPGRSRVAPDGDLSDIDADLREVLSAVSWVADPLGAIVLRCARPAASVLASLGRLQQLRLVEDLGGRWSRRSPDA
jgi:DNA processing protein